MASKQAGGEKVAEPGTDGAPEKRGEKTQAVKEAVAKGVIRPKEIVEYVRRKHGLAISPSYASGLKTQLLKSRPKPTKEGPAEEVPQSAPPPLQARGLTPQDLDDLAEIAARAGGVGKLKEFLDALGKLR